MHSVVLYQNPVVQASTWSLFREWLQGVTVLAYGIGRATFSVAESCDATAREAWPWALLLLQVLCAIAALKLLIYVLRTLEELAGFVFRLFRVIFYVYECAPDCCQMV